MKVLIVVGAKRNGNTDRIAQQFAKGAEAAGHEVEVENLFLKKDVHGCIDCQACKRNGGTCVWKDDIAPLMGKVLDADVLVFASPVYYFSISSQLKMFMDRTYAIIERISDKRFYLVTTAEGPSDKYAAGLKRVTEPVQGWVDCFVGMTFEKTISCHDTGTVDVAESSAYKEAYETGASL